MERYKLPQPAQKTRPGTFPGQLNKHTQREEDGRDLLAHLQQHTTTLNAAKLFVQRRKAEWSQSNIFQTYP